MNGVRWKIDNRQIVRRQVHEAIADGLGDFAEAMLTDANERVPIEEGTLERSGVTDLDRSALKAAIYYDTPYAARQHEDTSLRHDEGREAKWLENTLKSRGREMAPFLRGRIKKATGG